MEATATIKVSFAYNSNGFSHSPLKLVNPLLPSGMNTVLHFVLGYILLMMLGRII
jgi:hypothetical protein